MKENLKDILSSLNPDIDQETLLLYLQGKLSSEQQHNLEKNTTQGEFESDALEGLKQFKEQKKLELLVRELNSDLKKRTKKSKKHKENRKLQIEPWLLVAVIAVLLIAIIGFVIIHYHNTH